MLEHPKKHFRVLCLLIFVGVLIFLIGHPIVSPSIVLPNGTNVDADSTHIPEDPHNGDFFVKIDPLFIQGEALAEALNSPPEAVAYVQRDEKCGEVSRCVTGIINTRGRFDALEKQLSEIDETPYRDMKFIVVTDLLPEDKAFYGPFVSKIRRRKNVELIIVKFDDPAEWLGIGRGRNLALSYVETPYFLQLDDDFNWAHDNISEPLDLLETTDASIVGGRLANEHTFFGVFRYNIEDRILTSVTSVGFNDDCSDFEKTARGNYTGGAIQVHRVINMFLARTRDVKAMGGWNPYQRYNEHEDFFLRLVRHRLKVLFLGSFTVINQKTAYPEDANIQKSELKSIFFTQFLKNFDIDYLAQCGKPSFDKAANVCKKGLKLRRKEGYDAFNWTLPTFEFIDSASYLY